MSSDTKVSPKFSDNLYREMRDLIANCGTEANKHDLAIVTIEACIDNGINTKPQLIGFLQHLGFERGHIAHMLNFETASSRWRCTDGTYVINSA